MGVSTNGRYFPTGPSAHWTAWPYFTMFPTIRQGSMLLPTRHLLHEDLRPCSTASVPLHFPLALLAGTAVALTACNTNVKRVSPPATCVQQLTGWAPAATGFLALRLRTLSSMPMTFDNVELQMQVGDQDAGKARRTPGHLHRRRLGRCGQRELQPSAARIVVADALAGYRTSGLFRSRAPWPPPSQEKKQRCFEIDSRSTISTRPPGLPGVLR